MKLLNLFYALVVVGIFNGRQVDTVVPVIPALKTAVEVVSFGIEVYSFFDSILSEDEVKSTPAPVDYDRIINRISERIEMSTETIVFKIELQSYISELRDVALTVKQLLFDMENIIKTDSQNKREEYQKRFSENYGRHKTEIYKIRSLLTFSVDVSGISNTLLALIANEFECGMSKLEGFQNYYMTLVSDVVALALLNEKLAEQSLYNETLASWKDTIKSLFQDMEKQKSNCRAKFFELVKKDFDRISNPSELFENNQNRYNYKSTDVLFLSGGSYCAWNLKNYGSILKKKDEKTATFVFINEKENQAANSKEQYRKIAPTAKFKDCLEDINKILSYFDVLGEDLVLWLTFPTERANALKILLDQNSSVSKIEFVSDGTKYTTLFYVRAQQKGTNSTLTNADFDAMFHEEVVQQQEDASGLETWQLGVIIGGSALVLIIIIVVICKCYRRRRYY